MELEDEGGEGNASHYVAVWGPHGARAGGRNIATGQKPEWVYHYFHRDLGYFDGPDKRIIIKTAPCGGVNGGEGLGKPDSCPTTTRASRTMGTSSY